MQKNVMGSVERVLPDQRIKYYSVPEESPVDPTSAMIRDVQATPGRVDAQMDVNTRLPKVEQRAMLQDAADLQKQARDFDSGGFAPEIQGVYFHR